MREKLLSAVVALSLVTTLLLLALVYENTRTVNGLRETIQNLETTVQLQGNLDKNMLKTSWESSRGNEEVTTDVAQFATFEEAELEHDRRVRARQKKYPPV